jgi:hypothetical protein
MPPFLAVLRRNDDMQSANEPEKQPEYLTPTQVSKLLQIPESTLAVWRCTGRVRLAYFKFGHAVRYRSADVSGFIDGNSHGHAPV